MNRSNIGNDGKKQDGSYYGFNTKSKLVYKCVSKMSSPSKHKEAGKGRNATTCDFGSNSNEGDLTAHDVPSELNNSTQRAGHGKFTAHVNVDGESGVEEIVNTNNV
ncbi:hypothetical protein Tco_1258647 [Tanacetum coccineum]